MDFYYCSKVGYTCYFDSLGYIYKDQITFVGNKTYYLNGDGKMENSGWFRSQMEGTMVMLIQMEH